MERAIIDNATQWLVSRLPSTSVPTVSTVDITNALVTLSELPDVSATFLIPDLFPEIDLEVLYVHDVEIGAKNGSQKQQSPDGCSLAALKAIGAAIRNEMLATGSEVMSFKPHGTAELIVFQPHVRAAVLQATGTTLIPTAA